LGEIGVSQVWAKARLNSFTMNQCRLIRTLASSADAPDTNFLENVGTIDVVILRCFSPGPVNRNPQIDTGRKIRSDVKVPHAAALDSTADEAEKFGPTWHHLLPQGDGPEDDAYRIPSLRKHEYTTGIPSHSAVRPGHSFAQQTKMPAHDEMRPAAAGSLAQDNQPPDSDKMREDEERLITIQRYFNDIETTAATFRTVIDSIGFLENAIEQARSKAPAKTQSLNNEREKAIGTRDYLGGNIGDLLHTVLSHMSQLNFYESWRACRDCIVQAGWLKADHPDLQSTDGSRPGLTGFHHTDLEGQHNRSFQDQPQGPSKHLNNWLYEQQPTVQHETRPEREHHNDWLHQQQWKVLHDRAPQRSWGSQRDSNHGKSNYVQSEKDHWEKAQSVNQKSHDVWQADTNPTKLHCTASKHDPPLTDGSNSWGRHLDEQSNAQSARSHENHSSPPGARTIKSYWKTSLEHPTENPSSGREGPRDPYIYPAEQPPAVPAGQKRPVKHGVQIGKGVEYVHNLGTPKYLDTLSEPYAVFTFKYRSAKELEKLVGKSVQDDVRILNESVRRQQLLKLPREKLVEQLMRSKVTTASRSMASHEKADTEPSWNGPLKTDSKNENKTDWLNAQPSSRSGKQDKKSRASSKSRQHFSGGCSTNGEPKADAQRYKDWQETGQGETNRDAKW
jgi:hypothetical protein